MAISAALALALLGVRCLILARLRLDELLVTTSATSASGTVAAGSAGSTAAAVDVVRGVDAVVARLVADLINEVDGRVLVERDGLDILRRVRGRRGVALGLLLLLLLLRRGPGGLSALRGREGLLAEALRVVRGALLLWRSTADTVERLSDVIGEGLLASSCSSVFSRPHGHTSGATLGGPLGSKLLTSQPGSVRLAGGGVDRGAGTGHVRRRRQAAASDRALVVLVGHCGALGFVCLLFDVCERVIHKVQRGSK